MLHKLFGSRLRARVIGWLFTHTDERFYVRQLTDLLGEDSTNLSHELARLESMGIVVSERDGREKYYRANADSPIFEELQSLAVKTTGMLDVLREALAPHRSEIDVAVVFGSIADGTYTAKSDIDLLVVGDVDPLDLHAVISKAEERLRRTVNYTILSPEEFAKRRSEQEGFIANVLASPKLTVIGNLDDLSGHVVK